MTTARLNRPLFHFRHLLPILLASVLPGMAQNAITPTAVRTSSQWTAASEGASISMINGAGLNGAGSGLSQLHNADSLANGMWFAGSVAGGISGGVTGNPPPVNTQAVEFDLGANYDLVKAHVWNMNQSNFLGRAVKDVQILVSSSTTGAFVPVKSTQFTQGNGTWLAAQVVELTANNVRRVRFAIQSAWSGQADEYVGLSEVRFEGILKSVTIDDFSAGYNTVTSGTAPSLLSTTAGQTQFGEAVSTSILGNNRQSGVRDGHSANQVAMTILDGKLQCHGTANAAERFIHYGSKVGIPPSAPFAAGTAIPLNLSLLPEHQILIDVTQVPTPTASSSFFITLTNGSGNTVSQSYPVSSAGIIGLPLWTFPGMTAGFATDIDGITIHISGQGATAANGLHIDSISIALEDLMIDDFSAGFTTVTGGSAPTRLSDNSGLMRFGETVSATIIGNNRQASLRDGHSANEVSMTIQNGKLNLHGTATAPERYIRYGSSVGTPNPFASAAAAPLNLPLRLEHQMIIDVTQKTDQTSTATFHITLLSGSGGPLVKNVNVTTAGRIHIPLSSFAGMTKEIASDIDGIMISMNGTAFQGGTVSTGMQIDSVKIAMRSLVIDDFSAGYNTVTSGTAPTLLSTTGGQTQFGEAVSTSILGNNRQSGVRDGHSANQVAMTILDGKLQCHGTANAAERFIDYGSRVGIPPSAPFAAGTAIPLNLSLKPDDRILIDIAQKPDQVTAAGIIIELLSGAGGPLSFTASTTSSGLLSARLSSFPGMTPQIAADIDGIRILMNGPSFQGSTAATGLHIDSISVSLEVSTNANLSALTTTANMMAPAFAAATTSYTANVANATTSVTVTPTAQDAYSTLTVNNVAVNSGSPSAAIALNVGSNTITTVVTAPDGISTKTYTLTVTRAAAVPGAPTIGTATAGNASASVAFTAPASNGGSPITSYTVTSSPGGITATGAGSPINVTGLTNGTAYTFTVRATNAVGQGAASAASNSATPVSPLTGLVLAPTTVITTSMWDNAGLGGHKDKMINGDGLTGAGSVETRLHDANSNVNSWHAGPLAGGISGGTMGNPPTVSSQAAEFDLGANYDLTGAHIWNFNATNFIERGVKDVQILVSSGTSGAFTSLTTTQFTQGTGVNGLAAQAVPFTASNVRRVRFAIQSAWSGAASDYVGLSEVRFRGSAVPLSTNADLAALSTTALGLAPSFAAATTSYTANVPNATTSVTVTPTVAQANATVRVNSVVVASGAASGNITLNVGTNAITTVVTAQDGSTTKTYTLIVTRAASNNADLSALTTTANGMTPTFAAATTSYSATVPNATTSITVAPTVAQANATVKVNTVTVASGAASGNINLNVGANAITTVVTAQDGSTTKTYTLTVTRAAAAIPPSGNVLTPTVITTSQWSLSIDGWKDNMVNGLGLTGSGSDETKLHDAISNAFTMWHAGPLAGGISGGTTGTPPSVASQAVEFDLGANYNLTGAHVWNMNQAGALGRGVRGVEIFISPDATGSTWTSVGTQEFTQGTGLPLAAQAVSFTGSNARRVRFAIQSAWSGAVNDYVGLSEVRFRGVFAPVNVVGTNLGAIPDNNPTGRDILFNVAGAPGVVKTVSTQFTFNPAHAWMSDLRIQLISPNGTSAWIYLPSAGLSSDLLGPYTIADTGTASLQTASTGLGDGATLASGTYRAANGATLVSLNLSFAGASPNGIWKLRFADVVAPDTTSVSQASLTLTTASPGKPTIAYQTNGSKVFNLTSADSSASYLLQGSDNLSTWIPLQTFTTSGTGAASITDSTARGPRYFYRAVPVVTPGL